MWTSNKVQTIQLLLLQQQQQQQKGSNHMTENSISSTTIFKLDPVLGSTSITD